MIGLSLFGKINALNLEGWTSLPGTLPPSSVPHATCRIIYSDSNHHFYPGDTIKPKPGGLALVCTPLLMNTGTHRASFLLCNGHETGRIGEGVTEHLRLGELQWSLVGDPQGELIV